MSLVALKEIHQIWIEVVNIPVVSIQLKINCTIQQNVDVFMENPFDYIDFLSYASQ